MYLTTRYITKNIFSVSIFITLVLTSIIWLTQSLRFLELIVNSSAPIALFMKLIALSMPRFLEVIIPVAIMAAVIFIYNRMIADNELVVMRSSGIGPVSLSRPALIVSSVAVFILLLFSTYLSPIAHTEMQHLRQVIKAEYSSFLLREGVFNPIGSDMTIYLRERDKNGELRGLLIHDTRPENKTPVTISAKRGVMVTAEDEPKVLIYDGSRQQFDPESDSLNRLDFEQYTLEIKDFKSQVRKRWREADERTFFELLNPEFSTESMRNNFEHAFKAEAHKRLLMPFSALVYVMVVLCALLTGPFNRRGQMKRILFSIVVILILQSLYLSLANIAKHNVWAIPALYISIFLPLILGRFILSDKGCDVIRRLYLTLQAKRNHLPHKGKTA